MCFDECISFAFPSAIAPLALHINALELFVLVTAVRLWAPKLAGSRFRVTTMLPFRWFVLAVHGMPSCSVV